MIGSRAWIVASIVAAMGVGLAPPAAADHGVPHPTLRTERTWFTCADGQRVQNVALAQRRYPGWSTTAPSASLSQGGGCAFYDNLVFGAVVNEYPIDVTWVGTFTGNLDRLTVDMTTLWPASVWPRQLQLQTILIVDNVAVLFTNVSLPPGSPGASYPARFSITDIGLKPEDGNGVRERQVRLTLRAVNEGQHVFVWGASDVASGMEFNPTTLAPTVVSARG